MAVSGQPPSSRYARVSSLYGPGTTLCFYLTILSTLLAWTLHPKHRESGSINVDLIAILTLPTVAAGHVLYQVSNHTHQVDVVDLSQRLAAIEAPFSIVEAFMVVGSILLVISIRRRHARRAILVALPGLLCVATELYVRCSSFKEFGFGFLPPDAATDEPPAFDRPFVLVYCSLAVLVLNILTITVLPLSGVLIVWVQYHRRTYRTTDRVVLGRPNETVDQTHLLSPFTAFMDSHFETLEKFDNSLWSISRSVVWMSVVIFPGSDFLLPRLSSSDNAFAKLIVQIALAGTSTRGIGIWNEIKTSLSPFCPKSGSSIFTLDQGVAAAAGASVLGFSLFSVGEAWYKIQRKRRRNPSEPEATEAPGVSSGGPTSTANETVSDESPPLPAEHQDGLVLTTLKGRRTF